MAMFPQQVPGQLPVHAGLVSNPFGQDVKAEINAGIDGQPGESHTTDNETATTGAYVTWVHNGNKPGAKNTRRRKAR
jgi:hypothetical protein